MPAFGREGSCCAERGAAISIRNKTATALVPDPSARLLLLFTLHLASALRSSQHHTAAIQVEKCRISPRRTLSLSPYILVAAGTRLCLTGPAPANLLTNRLVLDTPARQKPYLQAISAVSIACVERAHLLKRSAHCHRATAGHEQLRKPVALAAGLVSGSDPDRLLRR